VIVLSDDIALAPGVLRIRKTGSAGGHNGLKSIIAHLGSQDFLRLRIGVGEKPHPEYDLADWVLGKFSPADNKVIDERMADIVAALELMIAGEPDKAISKYNGAKK
jgi:PTH1 family peptidyl-tRNA hydrolase